MAIKNLISKLLRREELNALEMAELERFDPEAAASESARLEKELAALSAEHEKLKTAHGELLRSRRIGELAASSGCIDPDFLDFLARRGQIDLEDPEASAKFISDMERAHPRCFGSALRPGVDSRRRAEEPRSGNAIPPDRIDAIIMGLDLAPDAK